jgi:NitT/TauT family transport system substrate-binding protein
MKKFGLIVTLAFTITVLAACGKKDSGEKAINVGYFPNISHAPAMVGIEKGIFKEELGDYEISTSNFSDGSLFMDALSTGQVDIGYAGPGPVLNRYLQGGEVVLLANASVGENVLVVRNDIEYNSVFDLEGKIVATASTGCTHDLILRKMLQVEGLAVEENGGTVKRLPQKQSTMIGLFEQKQIDAALVSEPWATLMEEQGVARVVVDANEVPWEGELPATVLVVRKDYLEKNPEAVAAFLKANDKAIEFLNNNKEESIQIIADQIKTITGQEMELNIIESSLTRVKFESDVNKEVIQEFADLSKELGFVEGDSDLTNLFKVD